MDIINANTQFAKDEIWELIKAMPKAKPVDMDSLKIWLGDNIGTELFNAWIAYKGDETEGFILAEMTLDENPLVYIAFCWVKPGSDVCSKLVERVETWAKENKVRKVIFEVYRNPMPFVKKYGYSIRMAQLEKDV